MAEKTTQDILYLNPLTLEASFFLQTLRSARNTYKQIDPILGNILINVMQEIESFLDQNPTEIIPTDKTKLVDVSELSNIKRFFMCSTCSYKNIGNNIGQAAMHLSNRHTRTPKEEKVEHKREDRSKNNNPPINLPKKAKSLISHHDITGFFVDNIKIAEKLKELPEYDIIEKELLDLATPLFPEQQIRVYKFGSRISGIGTRTSDLDIFIDIGNNFNTFENRASVQTLNNLKVVRNALRLHKEWKVMACIENARVPIIKVGNIKTGIECDIGFSNSLGYCNTKLVRYLFELQPISRCLCIYLKRWLDRTKLNEYISTYSLTMMVFYFLQLEKLMPSIEKMQIELETKLLVGPWIANFVDKTLEDYKIEKIEVNATVAKNYLKKFFNYYAVFKYDTNVICPYFGLCTVEIRQIDKAMPERYDEFVKNNRDSGIQLRKPMIVQDPIQLNHNITKGVSASLLQQFTEYCRQSAAQIELTH